MNKNRKYVQKPLPAQRIARPTDQLLAAVDLMRGSGLDGWANSQNTVSLATCLANEAQEVLEAAQKQDAQNLHEEIGDVLFLAMLVARVAQEDRGELFDFEDMAANAVEKLRRRAAHIFAGEAVNAEESVRRWAEAKKEEKEAAALATEE